MADEKKKYESITTPTGIAKFPWLTKPQLKYNTVDEYEYKCNLIVDGKAEGLNDLLKHLEEIAQEQFAQLKKDIKEAATKEKNPDKKKKILADIDKAEKYLPFELEFNDEEKETGNVIFKTKQATEFKNKKGNMVQIELTFFDAAGKKLSEAPSIFGGSKLRLNCQLNPFSSVGLKTAGVSLRLKAVQILELTKGRTAKDYGFSEEEGYTGEEETFDAGSHNY